MTQQEFSDLVGEAIFVEITNIERISEYDQDDKKVFIVKLNTGNQYSITISNHS